MKCPECGSRRVRVVMTAYTNQEQKIRRRHCEACDHRWYTLQPPEQPIDAYQLQWKGRGNCRSVVASLA